MSLTLICWDGRFVAADTQATRDATRSVLVARKLSVVDGQVYGFTGSAALRDPMLKWMVEGANPHGRPVVDCPNSKDSQIIRFNRDGSATMICWDLPYPETYFAPDGFGNSVELAIGAMMFGAHPMRAVQAAIKRKVWVGGAVDWVDLQDPELQIHRIAAESPWG